MIGLNDAAGAVKWILSLTHTHAHTHTHFLHDVGLISYDRFEGCSKSGEVDSLLGRDTTNNL